MRQGAIDLDQTNTAPSGRRDAASNILRETAPQSIDVTCWLAFTSDNDKNGAQSKFKDEMSTFARLADHRLEGIRSPASRYKSLRSHRRTSPQSAEIRHVSLENPYETTLNSRSAKSCRSVARSGLMHRPRRA